MAPLQRRPSGAGAGRGRRPARTGWPGGCASGIEPLADRYRDLFVQTYGAEQGEPVRLIEAFEVSEYGAPLDPPARARLFPFLPADSRAGSAFTRKEWVDMPEGE